MALFQNTLIGPPSHVRTFGSIAIFLAWIRLFYWMRLFKNTAYYVNLISQTIIDVKVFILLMIVMICAFSNLFSILNLNSDGAQLKHIEAE